MQVPDKAVAPVAAWGLYVLLKPVNRDLSLLFLVLNAMGVAVQAASYFPLSFAILSTDATRLTRLLGPNHPAPDQRIEQTRPGGPRGGSLDG